MLKTKQHESRGSGQWSRLAQSESLCIESFLTLLLGLQCHTAPFSWKLVFECDNQLYEVIMTACTRKEEIEWRTRLSPEIRQNCEQSNPTVYSSLSLNVKSLGTVFGKPGMARRGQRYHGYLLTSDTRYRCA